MAGASSADLQPPLPYPSPPHGTAATERMDARPNGGAEGCACVPGYRPLLRVARYARHSPNTDKYEPSDSASVGAANRPSLQTQFDRCPPPKRSFWDRIDRSAPRQPRLGAGHCLLVKAGHCLRVKAGHCLRVKAGHCLRVKAGHCLRVKAGHSLRVKAGHCLRVKAGHCLWVKAGHCLRVKAGHCLRVKAGHCLRVKAGHSLRVKAGHCLRVKAGHCLRVKAGGAGAKWRVHTRPCPSHTTQNPPLCAGYALAGRQYDAPCSAFVRQAVRSAAYGTTACGGGGFKDERHRESPIGAAGCRQQFILVTPPPPPTPISAALAAALRFG